MTESKELLPCPFCGRKPHIHLRGIGNMPRESDRYNVTCRTVDCHGEIFAISCHNFKTKEEAIAAWNTRHPDPRNAELKADFNTRLKALLEDEGALERAAEAIFNATDYAAIATYGIANHDTKESCREKAKAAIASILKSAGVV